MNDATFQRLIRRLGLIVAVAAAVLVGYGVDAAPAGLVLAGAMIIFPTYARGLEGAK